METDTKTIERIVKLMKQLSNTEYLSEIKKDKVKPEDIEKLRKDTEEMIKSLKEKGFVVAFPFAKKMYELTEVIKTDKIALSNALMSKAGPCYERIKEKNSLFIFYLDNLLEITNLNNILNKLPEVEKEKMKIVIEAGDIVEEIELPSHHNEMVKALNRIGIACVSTGTKIAKGTIERTEMKVNIKNKNLWIPVNEKDMISATIKEWEAVGIQIQIKNAKRQIMQFDPNEENEFQTLQMRYLEMIKKVDELIVKYGS